MANFNPPFSDNADFRYPTTDERNNGFDCGPADRELFNGLYHRIEAELGNVITGAGLVGTDSDLTQLMQAIQAMIDASTGGAETENYLLMSQARARLPIYPEILTTDGTITVISPAAATVRVPGGIQFMHRGIFPITTAQTDFTTEASNTYHIRWTVADGLVFKKLSDVAYNPSGLSETNAAFDSRYDDMLIARVITNSANVPTITNLRNKQELIAFGEEQDPRGDLTPTQYQDNTRPSQITKYTAVPINFARTPIAFMTAINDLSVQDTPHAGERNMGARALSRYQVAVWGQGDMELWIGWGARA